MSDLVWVALNEDLDAAFVIPCELTFMLGSRFARWRCPHPTREHGHLQLICEDGMAIIPLPISSQGFLEDVLSVIETTERISSATLPRLLKLPAVSALPIGRTPDELRMRDDGDFVHRATPSGWFGI